MDSIHKYIQVHLSQLKKLVGNHEFVQEHVRNWGDNIQADVEANFMSSLLPNDDSLQLKDGGWLLPNMLVQLIHGQHCKAVLESMIVMHAQLMKATMGGLLPTQSDTQPHLCRRALWTVLLQSTRMLMHGGMSGSMGNVSHTYIVTQLRHALIPT